MIQKVSFEFFFTSIFPLPQNFTNRRFYYFLRIRISFPSPLLLSSLGYIFRILFLLPLSFKNAILDSYGNSKRKDRGNPGITPLRTMTNEREKRDLVPTFLFLLCTAFWWHYISYFFYPKTIRNMKSTRVTKEREY